METYVPLDKGKKYADFLSSQRIRNKILVEFVDLKASNSQTAILKKDNENIFTFIILSSKNF